MEKDSSKIVSSVTLVNAFTYENPDGNKMLGNGAGVTYFGLDNDSFPDDSVMQEVAREVGLSETAFICKGQGNSFNLRWFTPTKEVDMCGHATLASAHYMYEAGVVSNDTEISFYTRSGVLKAKKKDDLIWMDFPKEALNGCGLPVGKEELKNILGINGTIDFFAMTMLNRDGFVVVDSEEAVRNLKPDMDELSKVDARGFIVTAKSDSKEFDFVSRFFAPRYGIPEDPVTGSAHCALCPYWAEQLSKNTDVMTGAQLSIDSKGNALGGVVKVVLDGERVKLGGMAEVTGEKEIEL